METKRSQASHAPHKDVEIQEWIDSLEAVLAVQGPSRAKEILSYLQTFAAHQRVAIHSLDTPYVNTIPVNEELSYPGDLALEQKITNIHRWNSIAMVIKANLKESGIGGHLSTYASAADLYEVGFNHFFRGRSAGHHSDSIFFQGHASPGMYARAFLEGRLSAAQLDNFRRECAPGGGLSSYPHPYLMPDFWEFPTVSMGLGPLCAIYQARFVRYLENRGLKPESDSRVWAFLGDGEMDEPESLGALSIAAREKLGRLSFVINCNLQRLDGPVRGNSKIVQELERIFRGNGWNVVKVMWSHEWDELFQRDDRRALVNRLTRMVDGEQQRLGIADLPTFKKELAGGDPDVQSLLESCSEEHLSKLKRGGHDPVKIYQAYAKAVANKDQPTVILVQTIKGYGLGASAEGKNVAHQQKKLDIADLKIFRDRFDIPLTDAQVEKLDYFKPDSSSPEMKYMLERRKALGGALPQRRSIVPTIGVSKPELFDEFATGTQGKEVSTTMAFVRMLAKLLKDSGVGKWVVPIVPDESRTFGMEALFAQVGIYSAVGQLYEPIDKSSVLSYKESVKGQLLQEGINEAGAMASFIAAGAAYATQGTPTIPFYIYYSMFGFQRVGDLAWAAADQGCRGFLIGGTSGRTTLSGEGLQHQDGHSHLLALPIPNLKAYDPAYAYEIAVILKDGLRRMYEYQENLFYYVTVGNENYAQPEKPAHVLDQDILSGLYLYRASTLAQNTSVNLVGMGAIMNETVAAASILENEFNISCNLYSMTSPKEIHRNAVECERWNLHHPEQDEKVPHVAQALGSDGTQLTVFATDYVKALSECFSKWIPHQVISLGTDGFGLSESRQELRNHFEVSKEHIVYTVLTGLYKQGKIPLATVVELKKRYRIAYAARPDIA